MVGDNFPLRISRTATKGGKVQLVNNRRIRFVSGEGTAETVIAILEPAVEQAAVVQLQRPFKAALVATLAFAGGLPLWLTEDFQETDIRQFGRRHLRAFHIRRQSVEPLGNAGHLPDGVEQLLRRKHARAVMRKIFSVITV